MTSRRYGNMRFRIAAFAAFAIGEACAAELTEEAVIESIRNAKRFLVGQQREDGSWGWRKQGAKDGLGDVPVYKVGISSLVLLSLINAQAENDDSPLAADVRKAIKNGLSYLRSVREPDPQLTYEVSLMIMAFAAAHDGTRDSARIAQLALKLEKGQITNGSGAGCWSYGGGSGLQNSSGDHSNGQFAILGLREAAQAGAKIDKNTWLSARKHWLEAQQGDGGWGYSTSHQPQSSGSMTVAGIATLVITAEMLRDEKEELDGAPICCFEHEPDKALDRGIRWLEQHFAVGHNPGGGGWLLYYLYGLERAGRLSGRRFFGDHDWYREGAQFLIDRQSQGTGEWQDTQGAETHPTVSTSFALLFLAKGLSPVLINKLQYAVEVAANNPGNGGPNDREWNLHRHDARNLTDLITTLPRWPKLLTSQVVQMQKVVEHGGVSDLRQSPILYLSGREKPRFSDAEVAILKEYVSGGGFIFAVNCCNGTGFHDGFAELVRRMYTDGEAALKPLPADHPIYRSEYSLDATTAELLGVDFGCRTAIVYSPNDISCLWDKWTRHPSKRSNQFLVLMDRATRIGVNVVAYATGREPPSKLNQEELAAESGQQDQIERGLLRIAKIRHTGEWDAAPKALRNLLLSVNQTVGLAASTKSQALPPTDPSIFNFPILFMHGRHAFQMSLQEREQLQRYLLQGGVLFTDACCGAPAFDRAVRSLLEQMFPDRKLEPIPKTHELFSTKVGHDLGTVRRRVSIAEDPKAAASTSIESGPPVLEGIEIDGRYVVIYSKYDISCALERQGSAACAGYVPEDAVKIGVNVVLYALLQEIGVAAESQ